MAADEALRALVPGFRTLKAIHDEGNLCRFDDPETPTNWCDECKAYDWNEKTRLQRKRQSAKNRMRTWYRALLKRGL